jgi:hypothetical protein
MYRPNNIAPVIASRPPMVAHTAMIIVVRLEGPELE